MVRDAGLREGHRAELQVGILVVVSLVVLAAGVLWISGTDLGAEVTPLHAVTSDAGAVASGDPVTYLGVEVGTVSRVTIDGRRVVVDLEVRRMDSLPVDTRATIRPSGFLGGSVVQLDPGSAPELLQAGDTIQASTVPELQNVAARVGDRAGEVMDRAGALLSEAAVRDVHRSAEGMAATMARLREMVDEQQGSVTRLTEHLRQVSSRLDTATDDGELDRTVANLDSLMAGLRRSSRELEASSESLNSLLGKMDRGEGTLGKLANDDRLYERAVDAATRIRDVSEELTALTRDLRENPGRYLKVSIF
jgi:phospholipid/cholesterol/gamma-HCH transport system substrate-binding protein